MKTKLIELGYKEVKPDLFMIESEDLDGDIVTIYHDYRKGKRWTYGFHLGESVDVSEHPEKIKIKLLEESSKCITLDKFSS